MTLNTRLLGALRDVRGLTQIDLQEATGLRQGYLSMLESGLRQPGPDALARLADALNVPPALLTDPTPVRGGEAQDLHFRRRKTLPVREHRRLEGKLHLAYITVQGLLQGVDFEPTLPLPVIDIDEHGDAAEAARRLRRLWRLPTGPIRHVTSYLEAAGMFLVPVDAPGKVDAVTRRGDRGWHVTVYNRTMPGDRDRLTKAHEAAHLVLHERSFGQETEDDANMFAAELLTPAAEIEPDLRGLSTRDIGRLMDLRLHWGVSLPFLVRRAQDLECVTPRTAKSLYTALNARGWLHSSVDDRVPVEQPTLLAKIVELHRVQHGYTVEDLAAAALMTPERVLSDLLPDDGGNRPRLVRVR